MKTELLAKVALVGGVEPLHYLLHLLLGWLLDVHLFGSEGEDLLELAAFDAAVVVDIDHIEGSFVDAVQFVLVLHQLLPH